MTYQLMKRKCRCEHWQTCPSCYPQGFDASGKRLPIKSNPLMGDLHKQQQADEALLRQALEALDGTEALLTSMDVQHLLLYGEVDKAITALRERLAQPQEPEQGAIKEQLPSVTP